MLRNKECIVQAAIHVCINKKQIQCEYRLCIRCSVTLKMLQSNGCTTYIHIVSHLVGSPLSLMMIGCLNKVIILMIVAIGVL